MSMLAVQGVTVRFGSFTAVEAMNMSVEHGQVVGLIGPNGAGKTTLVNTIFGVCHPTEGRILLRDRDLARLSPDRRARLGMARTFQNLELFGSMTVYENIIAHADVAAGRGVTALGRDARGKRRGRAHRVEHVLSTLRLGGLRERVVDELGYADRKLVEFARAMVAEIDLVLLDEPTAGVAVEERREVISRIQSYMNERSLAAIVVEHDMEVIRTLCQQVYVMDSGSLIAAGDFATVVADPQVRAAYLGSANPATTQAAPPRSATRDRG